MTVPEYLLLGIENPLLDISAPVDAKLLLKYNLKPNDAILADESHKRNHIITSELYPEFIGNYPVQYIAGGSCQNTCRGASYRIEC
jgi:adenosine kinase